MKIIFEDYYLLIVDKPAGLSSESGASRHPSAEQDALLYFTQALMKNSTSTRLKSTPYLHSVHRLDRPASGILVFAKTKTALVNLMEQFEQRTVEKTYLAVTERRPRTDQGMLAHWLRRDEAGKKAIVTDTLVRGGGQRCELEYKLLEKKGNGALLEIHPITGRYHQIRAQLAHIGCPIVGDVLYGGKFWALDRIKLHSHRLKCQHPKTGEPLEVESSPPEDW